MTILRERIMLVNEYMFVIPPVFACVCMHVYVVVEDQEAGSWRHREALTSRPVHTHSRNACARAPPCWFFIESVMTTASPESSQVRACVMFMHNLFKSPTNLFKPNCQTSTRTGHTFLRFYVTITTTVLEPIFASLLDLDLFFGPSWVEKTKLRFPLLPEWILTDLWLPWGSLGSL